MRKSIDFTFFFLVAACTMVLMFSACTLFSDSAKDSVVLTGKDAAKFIESIRARRGNAESSYNLGRHFQIRKKQKLAIIEFNKALECDPRYSKAYNALGVSYDALGDYALAVSSYKNALKINPNLDNVLNNLGYSYLLQDRPDLAIESFKKAVTLDSDNELYYNNLGLAYAKNGQFEAAYAEFRKSGDEARAHYNIAQLCYQKGLFKEAKEHFAKASLANNSDREDERVLKAADRIEEIMAKKSKAPQKTAETTVNTPAGQIIYSDDEKAYTMPAGNLDKSIAKEEEERERITENITSIPMAGMVRHADDGIYTIPDNALKQTESNETIKTVLNERGQDNTDKKGEERLVTVSMLQAETREKEQEGPEKVLEEKGPVIFNEYYAPQMLKHKKTSSKIRPENRINIEVQNGNGVNRMARRVGDYLRNSDFILMYLSNADNFNHKWSKIYYVSGYLREAYQLAQKLPGLQTLEEVSSIKDGNAEISILIGNDLIPYDTQFKRG